MENYSSMVEEYKPEGLTRFTPFVTLIRVALAIPLLVVMSPYPSGQSIGFLLYNIAVATWFVWFRPGKSLLKNIFVCIREGFILVINGLYIFLTFDSGKGDFYGTLIVGCMMAVYVLEMAAGMIETICFVVIWIKEWLFNSGKPPSTIKISPDPESSKDAMNNSPPPEKDLDASTDRPSNYSGQTKLEQNPDWLPVPHSHYKQRRDSIASKGTMDGSSGDQRGSFETQSERRDSVDERQSQRELVAPRSPTPSTFSQATKKTSRIIVVTPSTRR